MSALGRLSFIGSRPIPFKNSELKLAFEAFKANQRPNFGKTPFANTIKLSGKLGSHKVDIIDGLECKITDGYTPDESNLIVTVNEEKIDKMSKYQRAFVKSMHGTTNSLIRNYIEGVTEGHQVAVKLVGVGYRAALEGNVLSMRIGYSHPVNFNLSQGIQARIVNQTKILISGSDLQKVTQFAAQIRARRPPEPYNGKGIYVGDEQIIRKEGKKTK